MDETRISIKGEVSNLHQLCKDAEESIYLLQTAFIYESIRHVTECREKVSAMIETLRHISQHLGRLAADNQAIKSYTAVEEHLLKISEEIGKLAGLVEKKSREGILFSQKACDEVTFLLQRLIDLLGPTSVIILARNETLGNYIRESKKDITGKAMEYATFHEERLVKGDCHPVASALYLNILDTIKNIAWNASEIAIRLTE